MIRLTVICPDPNDATSFYRGIGPFSRLVKEHRNVSFVSEKEMNWSTTAPSDVVFMQRPFHVNHKLAAEMVSNQNLKLWVDYDDDLFSIGTDNPCHTLYSSGETQESVKALLKMADVVSVSTERLKTVYTPHNKNVVVIPNAFDEWMFDLSPITLPREKVILWRGTNTHERDLESVAPELIEISHSDRFKGWKFIFFGHNPWRITEKMKQGTCSFAPGQNIMVYMQMLCQMRPAIMMIPLANTEFNLGKSNCAWMEGTYAGASILGANLPEFDQPGITRYRSGTEFRETLFQMMEDPNLSEKYEASRSYIRNVLNLKRASALRYEIISQLTEIL